MKFDMKAIMKQANDLQQTMAKKQEELAKRTFEAASGGGMVSVKVNGRQELISIKIDPSVVSAGDIEMLEDLVIAAVNEGMKKVSESMKQEMSGMLGGFGGMGGLPGL